MREVSCWQPSWRGCQHRLVKYLSTPEMCCYTTLKLFYLKVATLKGYVNQTIIWLSRLKCSCYKYSFFYWYLLVRPQKNTYSGHVKKAHAHDRKYAPKTIKKASRHNVFAHEHSDGAQVLSGLTFIVPKVKISVAWYNSGCAIQMSSNETAPMHKVWDNQPSWSKLGQILIDLLHFSTNT